MGDKPTRVVVVGKPINKVLHWTLIVLTAGLWAPVYIWKLTHRKMQR